MRHLHIDLETYSDVNLKDCGVFKYTRDPSFKILIVAVAIDNEPVTVIDCSNDLTPGESLPGWFFDALTDPEVVKLAFNYMFEYVSISSYYKAKLDPSQWECVMLRAAYLGLPLKLETVAKVLSLPQQKDKEGKALIKFFTKPCPPTKANGGRTRNLPSHDAAKWEAFLKYCGQDVETEREVYNYCSRYPRPTNEEREYRLQDFEINNFGINVDIPFIKAAIQLNDRVVSTAKEKLKSLTGLANPNSVSQLKKWLSEKIGYEVTTLDKDSVEAALKNEDISPDVKRAFELRRIISNTSISKYSTMLDWANSDGLVRGLLQFYGANRTGRFAGRGIQIQNLKRTMGSELLETREAVLCGSAELIYSDVPGRISQLTRTAFIAGEGEMLVVSDFSAIEARVLAWIAGEEWVLDVFRSHGKIYEAMAANMFGVPIEAVTKGSDLRHKAKIVTLALGYQGWVGALIASGALEQGLTEEELPGLARAYRLANPHIVRLWGDVDKAVKMTIENKRTVKLQKKYCSLRFIYDRGYLFIELPSGRRLSYYGFEVIGGSLAYYGMDQVKKVWTQKNTYGGSLVENITQAIARDLLCDAMLRMRNEHNIQIAMHVHDEVVVRALASEAAGTLDKMNAVMSVGPAWSAGLPLKGEGYVSRLYKKD